MHKHGCMHHLRNIGFGNGAKAVQGILKSLLASTVEQAQLAGIRCVTGEVGVGLRSTLKFMGNTVDQDHFSVGKAFQQWCADGGAVRGKDGKLSVGATHRQFAETLRLYFDRDFYNFFESIYLVDGDALPELTFEMEHRLAPGILARLQSNLAAGGGGVLLNTGQVPYENDVRYMITSLDTQFERTSTGLFLSFHHLAQNLSPVETIRPREEDGQALKRLQVMVTQDLDFLKVLASDLALQLNMEFSRGSLPSGRQYDDPDQLRRRVTGGVAVKF